MQLFYLMLTGSLSGLISILGHSALWSGAQLLRGGPQTTAAMRGEVTVGEAVLHMLCGIALGALFWLSWGLAAVVDVAWWVRGLAFAGLCWLALSAPVIVELAIARRMALRDAALVAARWGTTCIVAGLACAWSWQNGRM